MLIIYQNLSLQILRGALPDKLIKELHKKVKIEKSFQLLSGIRNIQGNLNLKFRTSVDEKDIGFLYLMSDGWEKANVKFMNKDSEYSFYETAVPLSTYYIITK